jgi:hypothetical protein
MPSFGERCGDQRGCLELCCGNSLGGALSGLAFFGIKLWPIGHNFFVFLS